MPTRTPRRWIRGPRRLAARLNVLLMAGVAALVVSVASVLSAPGASAHVLPTSTVQLAVSEQVIVATVDIPLDDLASATGLDLGEGTQTDVDSAVGDLEGYLLAHFTPTDDDGRAWTVTEGDLTVNQAGNAATTGIYNQVETTFTLTPPQGEDVPNDFNLGYDVIVDKVATHTVIVAVASDSTDDGFDGAYSVGTVRRDTVTNQVEELHVELGSGAQATAFRDMVALGIQHIREGTDHQLFLLTLLLPAPLLARARRWAGPVGARRAIRNITTTTLAFTLGHSVTLALGVLGVPAPQQLVEAAIAVSILVAAAHALRPLFPGREALIAAGFGLVHGLAFSETLRALDLSGLHLVLALLGFNLGIELMQLVVVGLVLPPLVVLARTRGYQGLRVAAAAATAVAALGWLTARLGTPNPVATAADDLGVVAAPAVLLLWLAALLVAWVERSRQPLQPEPAPANHTAGPNPGIPPGRS